MTTVLLVAVSLVVGGAVGFLTVQLMARRRLEAAQLKAKGIIEAAQARTKELELGAKDESLRLKATAEVEYRERRGELQRQERRISQKEEALERRTETQERRERSLTTREKESESRYQEAQTLKRKQVERLEAIAALSTAEAKNLLLQRVEEEIKEEIGRKVREGEAQAREEVKRRAQKVVVEAIQRTATEVVSETTVSVVPLPSDDMKGRLIGREGRNIRALEQATGVDLIIDDTPEVVTLSCFDPVRREIARIALQKLILDGRIHPTRIEEMVDKARAEVEEAMVQAGEEAALKVRVPGLHPEIIKLLGRLKYRTSYGQNVLAHSVEVATLAGAMAADLEADLMVAKKAGLLHDIGKAVDHEVEGTHALLGAQIVEQWEKSPEVVQAIRYHHGEVEAVSVEDFIVAAADAISGARPGARGEMMEHYLQRLQALENLAQGFPGVEKAYAIQAGREVRIMVKPQEIDDLSAMRLARDIAKKIGETLQYPGQIKVTVIRETRAVEYAR